MKLSHIFLSHFFFGESFRLSSSSASFLLACLPSFDSLDSQSLSPSSSSISFVQKKKLLISTNCRNIVKECKVKIVAVVSLPPSFVHLCRGQVWVGIAGRNSSIVELLITQLDKHKREGEAISTRRTTSR